MSDPENKNPQQSKKDFDMEFEDILSSLKSDQYAEYLSEDGGNASDSQDEQTAQEEQEEESEDSLNTGEPVDFPEEVSEPDAETHKVGRLRAWLKKLPKKKKIALGIVAGFLALILAFGAVGFVYVQIKLNKLGGGSDVTDDTLDFDDEIYAEDDFSTIDADIHASSFKEGIRQWAMNGGEIMSSKNVVNVLIIGYDSRKNQFTGNTDAIMLLSLNKKTKELTLSSFLRDQYMYYKTDDGKTGYNKINAMCSIGGPDCLLQAIENHYKIKVDRYVAVNFASFKKLIDEMDGINVTVQKYESDYYYTYFKTTIPYGDNVHLTGTQALGFCRIRKCDSDGDVSRTRRQQMVIQAIIDKVSEASLLDVDNYLDAVLPYVTTNFSNSEIVSLGTRAMTGKWYDFTIQQMKLPTEEARYGYSGSTWMWVVDYPLAAQALQSAVFGMTNIALTEGRTTIIDLIRGTSGSGGASAQAKPSTTGGGGTVTTTKETVGQTAATQTTAEQTTAGTTAPVTTAVPTTVPTTEPTGVEQTTAGTTAPVSETSTTGG